MYIFPRESVSAERMPPLDIRIVVGRTIIILDVVVKREF
jgi:hypothetical protein